MALPGDDDWLEPEAWYASLPRKRMAAGVLVLDDDGRVLLVEPTYRETWDVPGGIVEADESPRAGAEREAQEELGVVLDVGRLLAVDWRAAAPPKTEVLLFLYDGGRLPCPVDALTLPAAELRGAAFVPLDDLDHRMTVPGATWIRAGIAAHGAGTVAELEG